MNPNYLPWLLVSASLLVHAGVVAVLMWLVRRRKDATSRRRALRKVGWAGVAIWALAGLLWSEWGLSYRALSPLVVPQMLTTWPAHEAALVLSGHGLGANLRTPVLVTAVCALVWALVLWAPLLTTKSRIVPVRSAVVAQILLLLLVALAFASFGNG